MENRLRPIAISALFALAACSNTSTPSNLPSANTGSGGGFVFASPTPAATASPNVSGDLLGIQSSRLASFSGTASIANNGLSLYDDPPSNNTQTVVLLNGASSPANPGRKQAAIQLASDGAGGYVMKNYTIYNTDGTVYAQGALPSGSEFIPGSLTAGQSFTPYPGMTAKVLAVGNVSGSSGCNSSTSNGAGATILYGFQGKTYTVSFVPGCGLTRYVDSDGNSLTLASQVTASSLGTLGDIAGMSRLGIFDNLVSVAKILVDGKGGWANTWRSIAAH